MGETCRPPQPGDPPYSDKELNLTIMPVSISWTMQLDSCWTLYDNTMVWFTADNGPEQNCPPASICQDDATHRYRPREGLGSAGPLRGRKRDIYEGGHRVAGIVSFPAVVKDNRESWETVVTTDFLPTVMELLGVDRPLEQQDWAFDGRSILPLLHNESFAWKDTKDGPRAIGIGFSDPKLKIVNGWGFRYGRWKFVEGSTSCQEPSCKKAQLYDLETDIGERHDLADEHPGILADLQIRFLEWHESVMRSRREESKCQHVKDLSLPKSIEALVA